MNDTLYQIDFTRSLPPTLKDDENMLALARSIAGELQKNARLSRLNIIYARIDELDERLLDVLAYDLHVDWYDYAYPIEAKRAVIRDSVRVHKRLGTLYAVETALGSVYPQSEVEEWFDYNGEPFSFRVVLDVTNAKAPAEYFEIKRAVDSYKRLTAHMDDLIYQCRADIEISVKSEWWFLSAYMTGRVLSGTVPQRNVVGRVAGGTVQIGTAAAGFGFTSTASGTEPGRSTTAELRETAINAPVTASAFGYEVGRAGRYKAGTEPQRATSGGVTDRRVEADTQARGFPFEVPFAGTEPQRTTAGKVVDRGVELDTAAQGFPFESPLAGTEPGRTTAADLFGGGIIPTVTAEGFTFRVKRCGTSRCKKVKE